MKATLPGPSVSPVGPKADEGKFSASVVRCPPARSTREMRPVVLTPGRKRGVGRPLCGTNPSGGEPGSATIRDPSGAKVNPRGLIRPVATTLAFAGSGGGLGWAVAGG